jgi:hypothetical protein
VQWKQDCIALLPVGRPANCPETPRHYRDSSVRISLCIRSRSNAMTLPCSGSRIALHCYLCGDQPTARTHLVTTMTAATAFHSIRAFRIVAPPVARSATGPAGNAGNFPSRTAVLPTFAFHRYYVALQPLCRGICGRPCIWLYFSHFPFNAMSGRS